MRVLAAIALAATAVACSSAPQRYTVFIPEPMTDCPRGAAVPRGLPAIVGPAALRAAFDRTESARARDHMVAAECRHTLQEVISIIDDFNEQQRKAH